MNLDQVIQTFLVECQELLEQFETGLLAFDEGDVDPEVINSLFRAAHTIKGSSGVFGYTDIVAFTHVVESVLDRVRDGKLAIVPELVTLLLSCRDHIGQLVEQIVVAGGQADAETLAQGQVLIAGLQQYLGDTPAAAKPLPVPAAVPTAVAVANNSPCATADGNTASGNWHISLRFGTGILRNGLDPLAIIRYLGTFGTLCKVVVIQDALPPLTEMDPEACYLGFEISYCSEADKKTIEEAFEFVQDDATIHILPPKSRISEYVALIESLPEDALRLGQILVRCGTLTDRELDEALNLQAEAHPEERPPLGQILVETGMVQPAVVEAAVDKQKAKAVRQQTTIRVDADKLDSLINLVGELVIAGAGATLVAAETASPRMQEVASTLARLIEEVRDGTLNLRMVQIGETFNRFQRVVRDISKELGKEIRLQIHGAETELDKTVVEKISDPLMHLIRNAMDHGIETADLRQQRGKPAAGTVSLNAFHDSGSIVIEVSDDGGGLNQEKILAKALEKGLVAPGHNLTEGEIYRLIFEPGFSTAEQLSNLSGRGVGMDVVKKNIDALRGTVEIDSTPLVGTTIRIRLPLTLAIIDGFLVRVGHASYVIPLDMVVECVELSPEQQRESNSRNYLNLRGQVLPYIRLREVFNHPEGSISRENVVVVRFGDMRAGLVVDALLGEFQTVIKPLGRVFSRVVGISGSTILGSGQVALILDVPRLVRQIESVETCA